MKFYNKWLKNNYGLLRVIQALAARRKAKLYLVGGAVRDIILKKEKENPDFDFCLKSGAINFARALAGEMKAGFVVLDKLHGCGRVVKKEQGKIITLDFSDFRGKTLEEDLLFRDFTINSMALSLEDALNGKSFEEALIDLYVGRGDLAKGVIKIVHPKSFDDDPLRIMRAFSLSAIFNFKINKETLRLISLKKKKLAGISSERVRDELFKILSSAKGYETVSQLDKYGLLELIFPELKKLKKMRKRPSHRIDVWGHTMFTLKNTELIIKNFNRSSAVKIYLSEQVSSGRRRAELLKLAALLHDAGKPSTLRVEKGKVSFHGHEQVGARLTGNIAERLKLSNEELRLLKTIVFLHLRPGYLVTTPVLTAKARFRFFRDAGGEAGSVLILALADERSTQGYLLLDKIRGKYEKIIPRMLREYFAKQKEEPAVRLVDGNDVMNKFKLQPSPLIGKILRELEELQALGRIKTKEEALKACAKILK